METIIQRVLLAAAFACGAVALVGSHLPAAVMTSGLVIAWAIYSGQVTPSGTKPR